VLGWVPCRPALHTRADAPTTRTGLLSEDLKAFLEVTLPKVKKGDKKPKFKLGVTEPKLGAAILEVRPNSTT
jgi:nucleolar protein 56